jgi:hypothetical protein
MYERFSDSARTVVSLAEAEAFARGAGQVEPEDLLVVLAQHPGVAGSVLRAVAVDPALARDGIAGVPPDPDRPATLRTRPLPLAEVTVTAFGLARREAEGFKVPYVATEHLLLGLLREPSGRVGDLLLSLRRDPGTIRERLFDLVATPGFVSPEQPLPTTVPPPEPGTAADSAEASRSGGALADADRSLLVTLLAEVRRLGAEVSGLRSEVSGLRSEVSGLRSELAGRGSELAGRGSELAGRGSEPGGTGGPPRVREDREGRRPA